MKEIIINNTENNKIICVLEDGNIIEKYDDSLENTQIEGNIYLGKITSVLPGMQAAFVDIGDERNAFLHLKDILPKVSNVTGNKEEDLSKYDIKKYVKVGMPILVEVKKDKIGKKGAKVSTNLNIAGKFCVIMPGNEFITISQKINNEVEVERLYNIINKLNLKNYGIILRTAAENVSEKEIIEDVNSLINTYKDIKISAEKIAENKNYKPVMLYEKGNMIERLLLDIGNQNLQKIITNNEEEYNFITEIVRDNKLKIDIQFLENKNILEFLGLQKQVEKSENRKIWLKCGGFITIDKTEALTAIDVNSGKFTGKEEIRKTILKVNSEASIEIAKQLRLRDIGGIVIIDYIDMDNKEDEQFIQNLLQENLKNDRAKTQIVGFTKLHLLEMTRKQIM